jgi:AcrR family transcriptional regulator
MIQETKNKMLQCASGLFFTKGFSVGVDEIISKSGVAKMTLYKHFKTKDGLICAILDEIQHSLREQIQADSTKQAKTPEAKLEAASLSLCEAMNDPELRAGLGTRALVEFPAPQGVIHERARELDLAILKWFGRFCEDALVPNAHQAAREILQIAKGCFLLAPTIGREASEAVALRLLSYVLDRD